MAGPLLITNGTVVTWQPGADLMGRARFMARTG